MLLKSRNLITAAGSVSDEPASVVWLAIRHLKYMLWVGEITLKNNYIMTTQYVILAPNQHSISTFHHFHAQLPEKDFKLKFDRCWTWNNRNILLWPCCTQATSIRLGTGLKCRKGTLTYNIRLSSLDFWIDDLNMVVDLVNCICQFCQFHDNSSCVVIPAKPQCLTSQQGVLGVFIVFCWSLILIPITKVEGNRPTPQSHSSHLTHRRF